MKIHAFLVLCIAAIAAAAAAPTLAAGASPDGLVAVQAHDLDQLYLLPHADLAAYHKVLIEPAHVAFRKDFNKNTQDILGFTRRLNADEVQKIADDTAASLSSAVAQAFAAQGYEIVTAPGPGVLRLSPSAVNLFLNAPNARPGGQFQTFTQQNDGETTVMLDANDAVSGALLGRVVDHRYADKVYRTVTRTSTTAENFWFENMFREWATTCAREFEATTPSRISLETPR